MKRRGLQLRANEVAGDAIKRCKVYLQKIANVPVSDWSTLEDLAKIRNCIVHTSGKVELSRDASRLRQLAAQANGLSISDNTFGEEGVLLISADFCERAVKDVGKFFEELLAVAGFKTDFDNF